MRIIFLTFLISITGADSVYSQTNKEYAETLTQLLEVTGSTRSMEALMEKLFEMAKIENPEMDETQLATFREVFLENRQKYREEKLVPIYRKYLSQDDLLEIIQFYKTPVGIKYAQNLPMLTIETQQAGMVWANEMIKITDKKMRKKN